MKTTIPYISNPVRCLLAFVALAMSLAAVPAQNGTWTSTIDGLWSTPSNWQGNTIANGAGTTAFFNAIDVPSNTTVTVTADFDQITFLPFTVGNLLFGDTDASASSVGNWLVADGGVGLVLDNTAGPNVVVDVNLAQGAANNLVAGWGTVQIAANLSTTNTLVKTGPGHLILNPSIQNFIGATIISNGMIQLGLTDQAGTANGIALGIVGPVIFRGGSLRLQNAAVPGSNPSNGGGGITGLSLPIVVETGQTGTLYLPPRAFPAFSGLVTGGGTLNVVADFVRGNIDGDWSGFTGRVNFMASTRQATSDLRFGGGLTPNSFANARVHITTNGINNNNLVWYNNGNNGTVFEIGELSATIPNVVSIFANNTGGGAGNSLPMVLQVGGLNTDASFSGNFNAPGTGNGIGIIKVGTGTWILNGNTIEYNGVTVIEGGVLQFGSGTSGKPGRSAVITNNATIAFGRSDTLVVTNVIDGPGALQQRGAGTLILAPATGANTYTGITTVTNGFLVPVPEEALGPNPGGFTANQLTLNGGGLRATNNLTIDDGNRGITLGAAGGAVNADEGATLTVVSPIAGSGSLTKNGAGTVVLQGANTYSGKTIVAEGTLAVASEGVLGSNPGVFTADQLTLNGGAFRSTATFTIDDANRGVSVGASGGTIAPDNGTTLTISRPIAGTGDLVKSGAGSLVINAADGHTGGLLVQQGTLSVGAAGSLPGPSLVSVASGATLNVSALAALNLASGQTLGGAGAVVGNVTVPAGGTITAGSSVGTLNITGNLSLSGGTNLVEIAATSNDVVNVTGNLALTGLSTIRLELLTPLPVGTYQLIKYTGTLTSGSAANLVLAGYPVSRIAGTLVHNAGTKSIDLVVSGTPGDLVWTGGLNGNAWDLNTTMNWLNGAVKDVFFDGDTVNFTSVGSSNPVVNLVGVLSPSVANVNAATAYTFSGAGRIGGLASLVKSGAGTLTVLTANDNTGGTTINGGTVQVGNGGTSGSLGSGDILNDGTLNYNVPGTQEVGGDITGTGSLGVQGGTVVLTGNNAYGATSISGGATLRVGDGGSTGSLGTGNVTDNGALVYDRAGTVTNAGSISGSGSLSVQGSGTVVLAANNSYAGATTVSEGTLQVGTGGTVGSLGTAGLVTLTNGGSLAFNRSDSLTNSAAIIGTNGTVIQAGTGTLVITNDNNDFGNTVVTAGRLQVGDGVNASGRIGRGAISLTSPGSLVFNRPDELLVTNVISGSGSVVHLGGTNLIIGTPGGANTYSGGTTISNSAIILTNVPNNEVGAQTANNRGLGTGPVTFLGNSSLTLAMANAQDPFGNGTGDFTNPINVPAGQTASLYLPGRFTMSGAWSGSGTVNLGVNYVRGNITANLSAFTGVLNVMSNAVNTTGTTLWDLRLFNTAGLPNAVVNLVSPVTMYWRGTGNSMVPIGEIHTEEGTTITGNGGAEGGNAVLWRIGGLNTDSTIAGSIGGSVAVGFIKEGTGKLTLSGFNTYLGNTIVSNGVLAVVNDGGFTTFGTLGNSAVVTVVSPGKIDVSGVLDNMLHIGETGTQTLEGNGVVEGGVYVGVSGTLGAGFGTTAFGNLTATSNVVVDGSVLLHIDHVGSAASDRITAPDITVNGLINVVQISTNDLQTGDKFQLFSGPVSGFGVTFATLPQFNFDGTIAYVWTNKLAIDGSIELLQGAEPTLNFNPTNLVFQVSGNNLVLSWPDSHLGWRLQAQTNSLNVGLSNNWVDIAGSTETNQVIIPLSKLPGSVFFRMITEKP